MLGHRRHRVNISPESEQQALELIQWAVAANRTIAIRGKNSKQGFGFQVEADCSVSMEKLTGILEYYPEELVMSALPGTPLEQVRQELDQHHQHLAFEPLALNRMYQVQDEGTIGGVFSGNLAGPRRFKAGSARDHILGVRAINGRGETWKSGGKVIKNVSGYDMSKLIAGSWGTLSVVTEVIFKVLPAPATSMSLAVWGLPTEQGMALLTDIISTPFETSGLAYLPEPALTAIGQSEMSFPGESLALMRLEGTKLSVSERLRALKQRLPDDYTASVIDQAESVSVWSWIRDVTPLHDAQRTPGILRVSIPPASVAGLTRFIDQLGGCIWYLDAAGSWLWVGICQAAGEDKLNAIRQEVSGIGGSTTLYRATATMKKNADIYSFADESIKRLNEKIKDSFDPANILNPGRLYHRHSGESLPLQDVSRGRNPVSDLSLFPAD